MLYEEYAVYSILWHEVELVPRVISAPFISLWINDPGYRSYYHSILWHEVELLPRVISANIHCQHGPCIGMRVEA